VWLKKPWNKLNEERISNHQEHKENFAQSAPRVEELAPLRPLCAIPIVFCGYKNLGINPNDERNSNHQEHKENFAQSAPRVEELAPLRPF
jgi:hypothetical protein